MAIVVSDKNKAATPPTTKEEATDVYQAIKEGSQTQVISLCQTRPDIINSTATIGSITKATPLIYASACGHEEIVQHLIQHGAYVNAIDDDGATPLFHAVSHGHKLVVSLLLQNGAYPSIGNKEGTLPLMMAAGKGYVNIMKMLMMMPEVEVNARNVHGSTALFYAGRYASWASN